MISESSSGSFNELVEIIVLSLFIESYTFFISD
jgi:hypothetical protein